VAPVGYNDLSRPPLPLRPSMQSRKSSTADSSRNNSMSMPPPMGASLSPGPPAPRKDSRTPSPEKKGRMLRTLRPGNKDGSRPSSARLPSSMRTRPPAAAKAATQAWGTNTATSRPVLAGNNNSSASLVPTHSAPGRTSFDRSGSALDSGKPSPQPPSQDLHQPQAPFYFRSGETPGSPAYQVPPPPSEPSPKSRLARKDVSSPKLQKDSLDTARIKSTQGNGTFLTYRNEYPAVTPDSRTLAASAAARSWNDLESDKYVASQEKALKKPPPPPPPSSNRGRPLRAREPTDTLSTTDDTDEAERKQRPPRRKAKAKEDTVRADLPPTPTLDVGNSSSDETESDEWKAKVKGILKNLPRGVDESAAQQILNDIVIQGDEVHWDDVAGLDVAKSALKETVVYPFLRPDLFMGLREPARGMLLFGPPGTGKTMLARTVATESKSTFFAISASSLTSKFLGESEKLVRALFALAKMLAPSIIFVDEIDSLLSSRSGSEHEATRRIKTEFLIQWSDLAKAAAGSEQSQRDKERGDASRVLVLAATNLPWAIDEAARRRFVRRQYIPLPEDHVRKAQLKRLMSHQKHELSDRDMDKLVLLTEGTYPATGPSPFSPQQSFILDFNAHADDVYQVSLAQTSQPSPKTPPWVLYAPLGKSYCI
jgi:SpoVK/Ycf46/Vps4 family AAA+-type ATPase